MDDREDTMSGRLIAQRFLVVLRADRRPELSLPPVITARCARGVTCCPDVNFTLDPIDVVQVQLPYLTSSHSEPGHHEDDASVTRAARRWKAADLKNSLQLLG